jgi:hypothetical protein
MDGEKREGKDLAKADVSWVDALKKFKWIRDVRKVGNVEISDPVDYPM